jgi:hypothetical protein
MQKIDSKIPVGPVAEKWSRHKSAIKVVSPANKRKLDIIVVGTGLGGASAAASLAELGYNVKAFCYQDSPRRAHSIAAQGGINAAKNYQNDNDSVFRLFYDTVKGGDYRAREANVYRLAEVSPNIIDQCVAQGVPFAREYGGLLDNRSFGGVLVSRTFYARGQTGQQLLLGAYQALNRQISKGNVKMYARHEMLDVVVKDGKARGIIARDLITGEIKRFGAHAVVDRHRRLRKRLFPFDHGHGVQRICRLAVLQKRGNVCQSLVCPDPSHLHTGSWKSTVEAHPDVGIACVTTAACGCLKSRKTQKNCGKGKSGRMIFRMKTAISTSKEDTPPMGTWFPAMWHHVRPKSVAMPVLA